MSYAADSDVNNRYGSPNVVKWCDMEGLGATPNAVAIAARRAAGLTWASARIDATLRTSDLSFQVPLTGTIPTVLVDVCVKLAGYWYATAHGVSSYDQYGKPISPLYADYQEALQTLDAIAKGQLNMGYTA